MQGWLVQDRDVIAKMNMEKSVQMLEALRNQLFSVEHGAVTVKRGSEVTTVMTSFMKEAFLEFADVVLQHTHINTARVLGLSKEFCIPYGKDSAARRRIWRESRQELYARLQVDGDCTKGDEETAILEELEDLKAACQAGLELVPETEYMVLDINKVLETNV